MKLMKQRFSGEKYKFLQHTADFKFQAFGESLEKCFENAAYALAEIISGEKIKSASRKKIKVEGNDLENLLYNFLEEFLFLLDTDNFLFSAIKDLKIENAGLGKKLKYKLNAEVYGDNVKNYKTFTDVKAITYNQMFVRQKNIKGKKMFVCQVVVDV